MADIITIQRPENFNDRQWIFFRSFITEAMYHGFAAAQSAETIASFLDRYLDREKMKSTSTSEGSD